MLETMLGSATRADLLRILVQNPDRDFHVRELVRLIGRGSSGVQREIDRLESVGVVRTREDERGRRVVRLAEDNPFAAPLAGLVAAEARAIYAPVARTAAELPADLLARLNPNIRDKAAAIVEACRRNGVTRVALFGSATQSSPNIAPRDLDVAVRFNYSDSRSPADLYFGLVDALTAIVQMPVDIVSSDAVENPELRTEIAETEVVLYEAA